MAPGSWLAENRPESRPGGSMGLELLETEPCALTDCGRWQLAYRRPIPAQIAKVSKVSLQSLTADGGPDNKSRQ